MAVEMNLRGTSQDSFRIGRSKAVLDASGLSAARAFALPDASGTLALEDNAGRNLIVNGGCRVSSRAAKSLTTSWQYAEVDLIAAKATGTVSAGTIVQQWVETLGSTGWAIRLKDVTLPGPGAQVHFRVRVESRDARRMKNRPAVFSCACHHDLGLAGGGDRPIDWHVTVNRANASDDFSGVTQIATGTSTIAPNINGALWLVVADMGDCSNGIEVIVTADADEATTNTFHLADLQLEPGTAKTVFANRPIAEEVALVQRYLRPCTGLIGIANSGSVMQITLSHPGMRAAPNYETTGALTFTDAVTADFTQSSGQIYQVFERTADKARIAAGNFSGLTPGRVMIERGTGGVVLASAEL